MRRIFSVVVPVMLVLVTPVTLAADLQVRVFDRRASQPLAGVSVCLGTPARMDQFGAKNTDARGYAVFESLPRAQLLVTASRDGFKGEQETMVTSNTNRMLVMSLTGGGGGPACHAADNSASQYQGGLQVTRFSINRGAASAASPFVSLNHALTGAVTQYRASERADFSDTDWQEYAAAPAFKLSPGAGSKQVYFQVRRHSTLSDAVVETLSPVVSDTISIGVH